MRKASGLRNKFRSGKSTYARRKKGADADRYGQWSNGRRTGSENIAGHVLNWVPSQER